MSLLIDGYNLLHEASRDYAAYGHSLSPAALCQILSRWASRRRRQVEIVFDGYPPADFGAAESRFEWVRIAFSRGDGNADEVIARRIESSTAPRRLLVVSSDRQVQRAARRRNCGRVDSGRFWQRVCKDLSRPRRAKEPIEKRVGLSADQLDYWLEQFGLG